MKRRLAVTALGIAMGLAAPAQAAASDGFAVFWKAFSAAAGKDNRAALATMVTLGPNLGDNGKAFTFDQMHAAYLKAGERACLAKAKPERTVDATGAPFYSTNCGDLIYVFYKSGAGWTLSDLSPND